MAVSQDRLQQLLAGFAKIKTQVEAVDLKYSLDYNEPLLDMPESLDLPRIDYTAKTDEQIRSEADEQVLARYISDLYALEKNYNAAVNKTERALLSIEESVRKTLARLAAEFNVDADEIRNKLINAGLLYSSALSKLTEKRRAQYQADVNNANTGAEAQREEINKQRQGLDENYQNTLDGIEAERQARAQTAYNNLKNKEEAERIRTEKYNAALEEKEQKYLYNRARAYENARQAEYSRAFAARKLRSQIGSVGYEKAILTEKYGILTRYVKSLGNKEEALAVVKSDSFCQVHLQDYYSSLIDYINRSLS